MKNNQKTYIIARLEDSLGMNGDIKVKIPLYEAKTGNLKLDSTGVVQYIDSID